MKQFNKFRGTRGFIMIWERMLRFRYMITEQAKERCRILAFWDKHGDEATKEAFNISRPSLYRWQKSLREGCGKLEAPKSWLARPETEEKADYSRSHRKNHSPGESASA